MKRQSFPTLGALRTSLFRLPQKAVAEATGIASNRLRALESGDATLTLDELDRLSATFGLPPESLVAPPFEITADDMVGGLALAADDRKLPPSVTLRILAAAEAARDLNALEAMAGEEPRWSRFRREVVQLAPPPQVCLPAHKEGRHYASKFRRWLKQKGWRKSPFISSMRDLVKELFPSVAVLYAHFGRQVDLAGVTFASPRQGATIVLNLDGRNSRATVRRFSLAHELCHLLVDSRGMMPVAELSEYRDEQTLRVEQRANAFAARLLCPQEAIHGLLRKHSPTETARLIVQQYGLHYGAVRLSLRWLANVELPARPKVGIDDQSWEEAESNPFVYNFPLPQVAPERRTDIARLGAWLFSKGRLNRREFAQVLGVERSAPVEEVEAFFADENRERTSSLPPPPGLYEPQAEPADTYPGEFVVYRGDHVIGHTPDETLARRLHAAASLRVHPKDPTFIRPGSRPPSGQPVLRGRVFGRHRTSH